MKKAIIATGGKQYLVAEGQTLDVDLIKTDKKTASFTPLLVVDGPKVQVGTPELDKLNVVAEIIEAEARAEKVTAIRYKAKKRVHKKRGHRQKYTTVRIKSIS